MDYQEVEKLKAYFRDEKMADTILNMPRGGGHKKFCRFHGNGKDLRMVDFESGIGFKLVCPECDRTIKGIGLYAYK